MAATVATIGHVQSGIPCTCSIAGGPDVACEIDSIRIDEVSVRLPLEPRAGERIVMSVPSLGLLEGRLSRRFRDLAIVSLAADRPLQAARIACFLQAATAPIGGSPRDKRKHQRIVPLHRLVQITLMSGRTFVARIVDISASGVAVTCMAPIFVGAVVTIGSRKGKVVRALEGGYAMAFERELAEALDPTIQL